MPCRDWLTEAVIAFPEVCICVAAPYAHPGLVDRILVRYALVRRTTHRTRT